MCGFAAAISIENVVIDKKNINSMARAIAHRGPDSQGIDVSNSVGMAHQRLSIVDLDGGEQPWKDIHCTLVYNGELYNHKELRGELESLGYIFKSQSDTEVVLKSYIAWKEKAFLRFDGMFSFVIHDKLENCLIAVRDRFGVKPLYVADNVNGTRLFASESQAVMSYDSSKEWALDPAGIDNYMRLGYYIEPKTAYQGIRQVLPGKYEIHHINKKSYSENTYWDPKDALSKKAEPISTEEGLVLLGAAVKSHSMKDNSVSMGTFLSGGVDSTFITSLLQSEIPYFETFSAGFDLPNFNEIPQAERTASLLGIGNNSVKIGKEILFRAREVSDIYGAPFSDNAALPTYEIAKLAREKGVKVVLSGDGADELFFGYRNHYAMFMENKIKRHIPENSIRNTFFSILGDTYPNSALMPRFLRAKSTLKSLSLPLGVSYCEAMSMASREQLDLIYTDSFKRRLNNREKTEIEFETIASEFDHQDTMKILQYIDLKTYLPGSVLTKLDRATMRAGIESRVPFLSNDISAYALSQNSQENISSGRNKKQLRAWSEGVIPGDAKKRAKQSFTSPLDSWFRSLHDRELYSIISFYKLVDSLIFSAEGIEKIIDQHKSGKSNHGTLLWALSVFSKSIK